MTKWEYKVVDIPNTEEAAENLINSYGYNGWELVAVCGHVESYNTPSRTVALSAGTHTTPAKSGVKTNQRAYFKRPKQ